MNDVSFSRIGCRQRQGGLGEAGSSHSADLHQSVIPWLEVFFWLALKWPREPDQHDLPLSRPAEGLWYLPRAWPAERGREEARMLLVEARNLARLVTVLENWSWGVLGRSASAVEKVQWDWRIR